MILFPEVAYDEAKFLARVQAVVKKVGWCVVVVSEGIRHADGRFVADAGGGKDAFGHSQLGGVGPLLAATVKDKLGLKVHWTVPDYLQRSARHLASKTDLAQAQAVGQAAVDYALAGRNGVMPVIVRTSRQALPLEDRAGAADRHRQPRKDDAQGLHRPLAATASPPPAAPTSSR